MSAQRGIRLVVIALLGSVLLVVLAANVAFIRDALAVVIAVGSVAGFFGLRLVAFRLRQPDDREFDFWGGMTETMDQLVARYRRPGGNPILPPDVSKAAALPDTVPTYEGHPVGQGSRRSTADMRMPPTRPVSGAP